MGVKLNTASGGSVSIEPTNTASNFTLTVPAQTGTTVIQNASNNLLMNSGYGSDAVAYGCRAWVNFNGTGTVAIRASGNVSSITDGGTGVYTVNFTNALTDANYAVSALAGYNNYISAIVRLDDSPAQTTTSVKLECAEGTGALADTPQFNVAIFR